MLSLKVKILCTLQVNSPSILKMSIEDNQLENTYIKTLQRVYWNLIMGCQLLWVKKHNRQGNLGFPGTVPEPPISVPTWYEAPWRLQDFEKRVSCADACKDLGIKCLHIGAQAEVLKLERDLKRLELLAELAAY